MADRKYPSLYNDDKLGEFMKQDPMEMDWSWLMQNRWPWDAPREGGTPYGSYQGQYIPFANVDWAQRYAQTKQTTPSATSTSPVPLYSGQESGWATDLAGIDPAWLAGQPANATIMSGGNVLRQGAPSQVYTIGGKDYTQEQILQLQATGLLDELIKQAQPPAGLTEWQKQDQERWLMDADAQRQQTYAAEMKNKLIQEGNAWQRQQAQMAADGSYHRVRG